MYASPSCGVVKAIAAARHVDARAVPLEVGVGQQREDAPRAARDVKALGAVARRVHVGDGGAPARVRHNAARHFAARILDELGVRPHADRRHEDVELDALSAAQGGRVFVEAGDAVAQVECRAVLFQLALHHGCARLVEDAGQHAACEVDDGDAADAVCDPFKAFEADQPRADDEHARRRGEVFFEGEGVCHLHKVEAVRHALDALHGRVEGARTGRDEQPAVLGGASVCKGHRLGGGVDALRPHAEAQLCAVVLVKGAGAVVHALFVRRAQQVVGDERPPVHEAVFIPRDEDAPAGIGRADALDRRDGRRRVADEDIVIFFHSAASRSSNTIAPLGQYLTQLGSPRPLSVHSAHFMAAWPSGAGNTAP